MASQICGFGAHATRCVKSNFDPLSSQQLESLATLPANTFIIDGSMSAAELAKRPFTVTRTVGMISVQSDQNVAVEIPFGAFGMRVVSDKAVATGAAAIPDPVTQVSDDAWYVYQ